MENGEIIVDSMPADVPANYQGDYDYWFHRHRRGAGRREFEADGRGSAGHLRAYKAAFVNAMARKYDCRTAIDLGCGSAWLYGLTSFDEYTGFDISPSAIWRAYLEHGCPKNAEFHIFDPERTELRRADVAVSLDVVYHITEEVDLWAYLAAMCEAARRLIVVYAADEDPVETDPPHIARRRFVPLIEKRGWRLAESPENPYADDPDVMSRFYVFVPEAATGQAEDEE